MRFLFGSLRSDAHKRHEGARHLATAGYKLEFESEEVAGRALLPCKEVEEATGWHDRAALHRASVCLKTDTAVDAAEFGIDEFDEGDNLFLEICFCLARCMPQAYFEGMCRYQDDAGMRLRIAVHCTEDGLRFVVRKTTKDRIGFWRLAWHRQDNGTFEKSLLNSYREVKR